MQRGTREKKGVKAGMHPVSEGKSESHTGWIMRRQDKRTRR